MNRSFMGRPAILILFLLIACSRESNIPVAERLSDARTSDGYYISWKEHLIDAPDISGFPLSGSDGLEMADLDLDGFPDIVSVHETDTVYDGISRGYIRLAFGSADPDQWELATLAEGEEAAAPEDVAIGDLNGDGWPDIVAACELAHLIYFQNPGRDIRSGAWQRTIPSATLDRGSFIRVFLADFNGNGQLEVTAPNKGSQHPGLDDPSLHPISWFEITGDPLDGGNWTEHELIRVRIPENARPVDLDGDGDSDILGASRGEERIFWFENLGKPEIAFTYHDIVIEKEGKPFPVTGVNLDFCDLSGDGRTDIIIFESPHKPNFGWIEQPPDPDSTWSFHHIGTVRPDALIGIVMTDINGDSLPDIMTGTYSGNPRKYDGDKTVNDALGRLAWFEHPGDPYGNWIRHDISRRIRGMFDQFVPLDADHDGDVDFFSTRGNSFPYDGVFWLEQVRTAEPLPRFTPQRSAESREMGLPD